MTINELAQSIERLHAELAQSSKVDAETLQSMRALLQEIQQFIARSEAIEPTNDPPTLSLTQRLREAVETFEAQHPQLTTALSQIADRLTDMGI
jgi:hypothetical protein